MSVLMRLTISSRFSVLAMAKGGSLAKSAARSPVPTVLRYSALGLGGAVRVAVSARSATPLGIITLRSDADAAVLIATPTRTPTPIRLMVLMLTLPAVARRDAA